MTVNDTNSKIEPGQENSRSLILGSAVVLTNGSLAHVDAKTAHGLIRGTERFDIKGIIDHNNAGQDAGEVLDGIRRTIPVYADIDAYIAAAGQKPDYAIIGVALCGGRLDEQWQALVLRIINRGVSIVNGMHMLLDDIPVFKEAARHNNVTIIDIRRPKPFNQLQFWSGKIFSMKIPRLAVLGTDCALGKRTTARMIVEACRKAEIHAEMIYTGQTGWLQGNRYGFILDTTVNDFVSGELEAAIIRCEQEARPDLIVVEGQSGMRNPQGPCGAEIIVSGNIKGVVLQHTPFREFYDATDALGCYLPDIDSEIKLIEMYGTSVIAVTLNGTGGSREELLSYRRTLEKRIGIPVICPIEEPIDKIMPVLQKFILDHGRLPDTTSRAMIKQKEACDD
ncbi:DUF1611 domain-containing protein [Desulfopila sp. IMCC35006]|uniref:DUF1611 domain-containing protein n=1 Tax=Desulfopila sp. IMCC35006 TaxID=2569542 RepID=UPI0010AB5126|nr:DUF1611 domain-containing protein [Desulfopila sp. IMCC35006]TKB28553.1 DUF1611 domain-containing protein [Desulfopila sp. IMCC35006]